MKTYKTSIGCMTAFLLLIAGCSDKTDENIEAPDIVNIDTVEEKAEDDEIYTAVLTSEITREIIIDIHDGEDGYSAFRMLTETDDLERSKPKVFKKVWEILDNANWETAEVSMSRSADFRFETIDNRNKEKQVSTTYYLWISPGGKKVELVNDSKPLYVQLNESDSETLYKLLVGENLSDHVVIE
ncbi:hypothetical protein [Domibacillus iocasae]|uniref:Lipoprotein n=1 Tax=Domibacillus iocasae TaxID=1714016 RepID=A0A1E7DSH1_9BACI|nr:hypothetical protein [Domibacillus iocasae]OES46022.1 hypothetical protein BA724_16790 [Domibacillus iocasae]